MSRRHYYHQQQRAGGSRSPISDLQQRTNELTTVTDEMRTTIIDDYLREQALQHQSRYQRHLDEVRDFGFTVGILRDVLKAKTGLWKAFWTVMAVVAIGMFVFCTIEVMNEIAENPTTTKITYKVSQALDFPVVTVCTYARVNESKIREMNISTDLLSYMLSAFKGMYLFYNQFNIRNKGDDLQRQYEEFKESQRRNFSLTGFFIENGFSCHETMAICMFQGTNFDCCGRRQEILSEIGKCFVVRSPKYDIQSIPGPSGGLKLYIKNWKNEYPESFVNSNPDLGVQIHIIHPGATSFIGHSPLIVFPGTHAMVRLQAVHQVLFNNCLNPRLNPLRYYTSYSFEGCFTECIANMTQQTCGCVQIGSVPNYEQLEKTGKLCEPIQATSCVQPLLQANNMGFLWDIYDIKEKCVCPLSCEQWLYETSVSYSRLPNPGYRAALDRRREDAGNIFQSFFTDTASNCSTNCSLSYRSKRQPAATFETDEDYLVVDLYFDNLVYQQIEETETANMVHALSLIGGQLSVWLGVRLVTLLHLIYYAALTVLHLLPEWLTRLRRRAAVGNRNSNPIAVTDASRDVVVRRHHSTPSTSSTFLYPDETPVTISHSGSTGSANQPTTIISLHRHQTDAF